MILTRQLCNEHDKEHTMADLEHNKQTVIAFITRAFNDKQPADAVAKYVGSQYIQHDPQSPDGAEGIYRSSSTGFVGQVPQLSIEHQTRHRGGRSGCGPRPDQDAA